MNKHLDKTTRKYMRAARRLLICPKEYRSQFIKDMERDMEQFIQENKPDGYPDIVSYFGTPAELAQTYLSSVPQDELAEYKTKRKFHATVLFIILVILLIGTAVLLFYKLNEPYEATIIHVEESIETLNESTE